ncbi:MAG: DNA gyrase inhibitor YacG [Brevundimonas sp.]|uniref:DNA gyrase inhibitor YacG n=1 Tax=Brevundimonas sp. TaxID=1871086 RepID=UPI00391DF399
MTRAACPICRHAEADPKYRPFCSKRCADIDLGRWFTGRYAVPGPPVDENGESDSEDQA